jgi:hypothetical protein
MTKKEEKAVNTFLLGMIRNKRKALVPETRFNRKAQKGRMLVCLPMEDIIKGWKKLRKAVEGKSRGK